jgi:hypothetical protein
MYNSSSLRLLLIFSMMAGWPPTSSSAQDRPSATAPTREFAAPLPEPPNQPYPPTFRPSFQWNYACTRQNNSAGCVFSCSPNVAISSVFVAQVWLGTTDLGTGPGMAIYYHVLYYNGAEKVAGSGFAQSTRNLACQALGMKITYSGPPK